MEIARDLRWVGPRCRHAGVSKWVRATTLAGMSRTAVGVLPSRVLAEHRLEVLDLVRARGASNVRVFGSVARGEDTPSSDVDLLVDFPAGTSLLAVIGLEQSLRDLLG